MNEIRINIAKDFSETPGVRYISQGKYTGEGFRKKKLEPLFQDKNDNRKIIIELDGTFGYPTSFSEEAFGGLARIYGKKLVKKRLKFVANEEPLLIKEIMTYINGIE